jgi:hypothetical protein
MNKGIKTRLADGMKGYDLYSFVLAVLRSRIITRIDSAIGSELASELYKSGIEFKCKLIRASTAFTGRYGSESSESSNSQTSHQSR